MLLLYGNLTGLFFAEGITFFSNNELIKNVETEITKYLVCSKKLTDLFMSFLQEK